MDISRSKKPILLVGVPRSGTTWTAKILAKASDVYLIHEPSNEKNNLLAYLVKKKKHRMPYLSSQSQDDKFYKYWEYIFYKSILPENTFLNRTLLVFSEVIGKIINKNVIFDFNYGQNSVANENSKLKSFKQKISIDTSQINENRRIIKSVHAGLSLTFLYENFEPHIIILFRHPANIISSYLRMKLPDSNRKVFKQKSLLKDYLKPYESQIKELKNPLSLMGLQVAIFYYVWEQQLKHYSDWLSVTHENLCIKPEEKFKKLFEKLDLSWSDRINNYIKRTNTKGEGYETKRIAALEPEKWKRELDQDQIDAIRKGYSVLPVKHYREFQNNT